MLFAVSGWHDVLLALLLIWIEAWQLELAISQFGALHAFKAISGMMLWTKTSIL